MESVASRYALALFKLAESKAEQGTLRDQVNACQTLIQRDASWFLFLKNPFYTLSQKFSFIDTTFSSETWGMINPFLKLLIKNHRIQALVGILVEANRLCEQALAMKRGVLYVASPLTPNQKEAITTALASQLHIDLTLTEQKDPTLIGGFRVEIDGKVYDASIIGKLEALQRHLKNRG
jgi:F-type H+-transporting ATPase subunit delta